MFTKIMEEERWENLYNGINKTDFELWINTEAEYRHGQIEDLSITCNSNMSIIKVCSRNLMEFLKLYGIEPNFEGSFSVIRKANKYAISLSNPECKLRYECNSRSILKPINNLAKTIEAQRKLAGTSLNIGNWQISDVMLIHALSQSVHEAILLLEPFSTNRIVKRLKSTEFRHKFKLIHPDTKFIKTEQPENE